MGIFSKKKIADKKEDKKQERPVEINSVKKENKDTKKPGMKDLYEGKEGEKITTKKSVAADKKGNAEKKSKFTESYRILTRPLVTEKASNMGAQNKYAFVVDIKANKISVAKAVEYIYGIKPIKVNIIKREGKVTKNRFGGGKRKDWKKAIVTLPEGKSINIYEGV